MTMPPDSARLSGDSAYDRLYRQREQAWIGVILAAVLTYVILWTNFQKEHPELETTRRAVAQHREMLEEHYGIFKAVQLALATNQQELEKLKQANNRSP